MAINDMTVEQSNTILAGVLSEAQGNHIFSLTLSNNLK